MTPEGVTGGGFHIGHNTVGGDQIFQNGQYNVGKVDSRSAPSNSSVAFGTRADAIQDLTAFIDTLERLGIVTHAGAVSDAQALEDQVIEHRPRLERVALALAGGARDVLVKAVSSASAPLVLHVIDRLFK